MISNIILTTEIKNILIFLKNVQLEWTTWMKPLVTLPALRKEMTTIHPDLFAFYISRRLQPSMDGRIECGP